jgi:hypothetical protein
MQLFAQESPLATSPHFKSLLSGVFLMYKEFHDQIMEEARESEGPAKKTFDKLKRFKEDLK